MSGRLLPDTNLIVAILNNDSVIKAKFAQEQMLYLSSTVLGELYYGAYNSQRVQDNIQRIRLYFSASQLLVCDEHTAECYGAIKATLRQKGKPIPENDIWIAALAIQHSLILATRDAHFRESRKARC